MKLPVSFNLFISFFFLFSLFSFVLCLFCTSQLFHRYICCNPWSDCRWLSPWIICSNTGKLWYVMLLQCFEIIIFVKWTFCNEASFTRLIKFHTIPLSSSLLGTLQELLLVSLIRWPWICYCFILILLHLFYSAFYYSKKISNAVQWIPSRSPTNWASFNHSRSCKRNWITILICWYSSLS